MAPSVVAVVVVHEPGDWFEETLRALAAQDYPNFRTLFLVTSSDHDDDAVAHTGDRIRAVLPGAFVRSLGHNPGFGPAVNEVLRLVEGDNGFFLLCHDDIAPEPSAVRTMVAELYRSNAGVIGPKLTEWDSPRTLQHVGLGLDRFGEVDPLVEPGEVDQEQHDAVRDVFVLPSACLLFRADLFRLLGGYDPAINFFGDDVDLCWRAHLTGARVVVAPDATVRHREALADRRPDLNQRTLQARHRMRALATLTGARRLFARSVQLVALTLVELVVGLFTGRFGEALASLRALIGMVPRTGSVIARRRLIRPQRQVPEREILGLQIRGSARLSSYLRGRETTTYVSEGTLVRRWRETSFGPLLAWFLVIAAFVIGSRTFINSGVPAVGEFLTFPSARDLMDSFRTGYDPRGFGSTSAAPTGYATLAGASAFALFRTDLAMTMSIVSLFLVGAIGAWRLATVFPVNRARIAAMVVYAATPLLPGLLGSGRWSVLLWYAALPWLVHLLRRSAGIETADPSSAERDLVDGIANIALRQRVRIVASLSLVLAIAIAFVPSIAVLWALVGVILAVATLLALGSWRTSGWLLGCTAVSIVVAFILNLPWSATWTWSHIVGADFAGGGEGIVKIATFDLTGMPFAVLALALYVPVVGAVAIARAWRLTWAVRAAGLVLSFGALAIFSDRGSSPVVLADPSMLYVPIVLGLAISAAAITGGFGTDVLGRGFGWRQPAAILANLCIVIGLVPAAIAIGAGDWDAPGTPLPVLLAAQLPANPESGDFRVLYVGDPRVVPGVPKAYRDGISYSVLDGGPLDFRDRWIVPDTELDDALIDALDLIAERSTLRAGLLLAPLGIKYVVVPKVDGASSTLADPVPVPGGLLESLDAQIDIGRTFGPPSLELFQNRSWIPVSAQLLGTSADESFAESDADLVRAQLSGVAPAFVGVLERGSAAETAMMPGVVHLAVAPSDDWTLTAKGSEIAARTGFGRTTAFDLDVPVEGPGDTVALVYNEPTGRNGWLFAQVVAWLFVAVAATSARTPFGRRRTGDVLDETLIDFGDEPDVDATAVVGSASVIGEVLGSPTGEIERPDLDGVLDDPDDRDDAPDPAGGGEIELEDVLDEASSDEVARLPGSPAITGSPPPGGNQPLPAARSPFPDGGSAGHTPGSDGASRRSLPFEPTDDDEAGLDDLIAGWADDEQGETQ